MSFYRTVIAAVAALGLAGAVFADDAATTTTNTTSTTTQQTTATDATMSQVNINTATAKDLAKVKGITKAKARAIVAYRKKNGNFKTLDDLKMVNGFKKMDDQSMKAIQDQLTTG